MKEYWKTKSLRDMTQPEWEALCDGCARCCMIKLEDDDGGVHHTALVCDLLDREACRCTRYAERHRLVKDCIVLSADLAESLAWLPTTCAYRRVAEGRDLAGWHPLVSGDPNSVHAAGISVRDKVVPVSWVHPQEHEQHIVHWVTTT